MPDEIKIVHNNGHYEVYIDGKFYCSADKESEAESEIENYLKERGDQNEIESA